MTAGPRSGGPPAGNTSWSPGTTSRMTRCPSAPSRPTRSLKDGAANMVDKKRNHHQTERTAADKARHKAIREKLKSRPTPEELVESGAYDQPVPHGLVLDAMRLLGQLRAVREAAHLTLADVSH